MFCAACGSEVQEGLRYCNRCGANLAAAIAEETPTPRLFGILLALLIATALIGAIGLTAIFFFAVELLGRGNIPAETPIFLVVFTLAVFGIEALLIRQLSRVLDVYLKSGKSVMSTAQTARQTPEPQFNKTSAAGELSEPTQSFIPAQSAQQNSETAATRILQNEETATRKLETD